MNKLLPPTYADISRNLRLLAEDWVRGGWQMRYFVVSQFAAAFLSLTCSAASVVSIVSGEPGTGLWLVSAAGITLMHAFGCWSVLRRRYQVRFALW